MPLPIDEKWLYEPTELTQSSTPFLVIMMGLSGSGKSTASGMIAHERQAAWVCADVVRKRLYGLRPEQSSKAAGLNIYAPAAHKKTFTQMDSLAHTLLESGYSVILDSAALRTIERQQFIDIAKKLNNTCAIVYCKAQESTINKRLCNRLKKPGAPSEATVDIMKQQLDWLEEPCSIDAPLIISLNTDHLFWQDELKRQLERYGI